MSSHREAPEIAQDPVADSTDVYAFVSPDRPDTVTLIANYVPLQEPAGGPNFYEFGDEVLYSINIDNDGDGKADIRYDFRFTTEVRNPNTFLYNTGPILSLDSPNWNRRQFYTVTRRVRGGQDQVLGTRIPSPPCNIGPLSTPNYVNLANAAIRDLGGGRRVFCGQRNEGFYVDLGAVFDLLNPRPFADLHIKFGLPSAPKSGPGVNATKDLNVHTIALQVPISDLTKDGWTGTNVSDPRATIGVWTAASRKRVRMFDFDLSNTWSTGPFRQVSRLAMPLLNEVVIPMGQKDFWNTQAPDGDARFSKYLRKPEVAQLLPVLFPGVFPRLDALNKSGKDRTDIVAILHTGIPAGLIPGFQNFTGPVEADMMRLNTAIRPSATPNINGLLGGDLAGFPNGRRVFDDVVAIELKALAGVTYALVDRTFTPDAAAAQLDDGVTPSSLRIPFLNRFPYLGTPLDGFNTPAR